MRSSIFKYPKTVMLHLMTFYHAFFLKLKIFFYGPLHFSIAKFIHAIYYTSVKLAQYWKENKYCLKKILVNTFVNCERHYVENTSWTEYKGRKLINHNNNS